MIGGIIMSLAMLYAIGVALHQPGSRRGWFVAVGVWALLFFGGAFVARFEPPALAPEGPPLEIRAR